MVPVLTYEHHAPTVGTKFGWVFGRAPNQVPTWGQVHRTPSGGVAAAAFFGRGAFRLRRGWERAPPRKERRVFPLASLEKPRMAFRKMWLTYFTGVTQTLSLSA